MCAIITFCSFSMGRNQYWAGRVYDLCVYYMTGTPEGSTESDFMEKPGIEPATPGLQGIALIHYTTGYNQSFPKLTPAHPPNNFLKFIVFKNHLRNKPHLHIKGNMRFIP